MVTLPFALPPSLGQEDAARRAHRLEVYLAHALGRDVVIRVAGNYQSLERDLLSGAVAAAWGPPFVCARTEAYGGRGLVRGIRHGLATYRSALVALKSRKVKLENGGYRAAWVDRDSTGGYLLAQAALRERRLPAWKVFTEERFLGSYRSALEEVMKGRADVTAVWCASAGGPATLPVLTELLGDRADELEVLGFTRDCPNDGVVLSPKADAPTAAALERAFLTLAEDPEGRAIAGDVFGAERFEAAPRGSYRALYDLVFASLG